MRDTPLQAMEQLMMSQPGQKPRGGGIYRSPFHYTPKDVACKYCQNYDRKHSCRLYECTCLEERIEAGVLGLNAFMRDCFALSMGAQLRKRMHQQFRERKPQFFLSDAHRRRWTHWRERCWRLSDRNKAALFLLTAYESLWRRMVWKCGNDGFDFQNVGLGGIEPELYSVYQAAKAIAVGCCNITLADLASPELVTDEAFHLITGSLLMAKYHLRRLCAQQSDGGAALQGAGQPHGTQRLRQQRKERSQSKPTNDGATTHDTGRTEIHPQRQLCGHENGDASYADKAAPVSGLGHYLR